MVGYLICVPVYSVRSCRYLPRRIRSTACRPADRAKSRLLAPLLLAGPSCPAPAGGRLFRPNNYFLSAAGRVFFGRIPEALRAGTRVLSSQARSAGAKRRVQLRVVPSPVRRNDWAIDSARQPQDWGNAAPA